MFGFRNCSGKGLLLVWLVFSFDVYADEATAEPQRVVAVGGALTEIIYALGAEDKLAGVDTTSLYPKSATELPQVGYQRALSAEGLLSLSPDIVLATDQAGPPAVIEQIKQAGVRIVIIPTEYSAEGVATKIRMVAEALGLADEGQRMESEFRQQMQVLNDEIAVKETADADSKVVFLLNVGQGSPMAAGTNTASDAMIALSGAKNALSGHEGYKPVSTEAMVAANPDILLMPQRTIDGLGGPEGVLNLPGVSITHAGKTGRIVSMEGLYLLGFTPRLPEAVRDLHQLLFATKPVVNAVEKTATQNLSQQ